MSFIKTTKCNTKIYIYKDIQHIYTRIIFFINFVLLMCFSPTRISTIFFGRQFFPSSYHIIVYYEVKYHHQANPWTFLLRRTSYIYIDICDECVYIYIYHISERLINIVKPIGIIIIASNIQNQPILSYIIYNIFFCFASFLFFFFVQI